jgi:hypothetical protein
MNYFAPLIAHSVETNATRDFAWSYMTDVRNWDDPPATFRLDGAFTSGSFGTTEMPGQAPRQWCLREVTPPQTYTVEIPLDGALLQCKWTFADLPNSRTELTQQIHLVGEKAFFYKEDVERAFAATLAPGMTRIARAIDMAFARNKHG